ncbi:hypothetical protein [Mesorhizobium jarvisii]|uniref:hypothetical protein n=1 Tax=Mesorhizobium jarvisii TaxID=1777867 RepID=UPI001F0B2463|nr:hypothetical protein [Mesorhizobium jarvisii]MCH4560343.1 hypothetical protein [Mesorhizobium jarvisii]
MKNAEFSSTRTAKDWGGGCERRARMLPENAFLRKLPNTIDEAQAIKLEGLVFSADAVEFSFNEIKRIALIFGEKITDAPSGVRTRVFIDAWNMVDNLHVIRQVIKSMDVAGERTDEFLAKYETASLLRNKMDHLAANAFNISKASKRNPLHGSVSYAYVPESEIKEVDGKLTLNGAGIVVISSGRLVPKSSIAVVNPAGMLISDRAGLFQLEAFGLVLNLENAVRDMSAYLMKINDSFEENFLKTITNIAVEKGLNVDDLKHNNAAGLTVYLTVKFTPPSIASEGETDPSSGA